MKTKCDPRRRRAISAILWGARRGCSVWTRRSRRFYDARNQLRGVFWLDHDTGHVRSQHKIEAFYEDEGVCFERAGVELMVLTTAQLHRLTGVVHAAWPECECNAKYGCDCERPDRFISRLTGHLPHLFLSDVACEQ